MPKELGVGVRVRTGWVPLHWVTDDPKSGLDPRLKHGVVTAYDGVHISRRTMRRNHYWEVQLDAWPHKITIAEWLLAPLGDDDDTDEAAGNMELKDVDFYDLIKDVGFY